MKAATTPDVWRGSSQALRMISGLRKMPPPVPVRPASRPSTAPAGRLIHGGGALGLALGQRLRLPQQPRRRGPQQQPDQRLVVDRGQMDPAADERGRRRGQREGQHQLPVGQAAPRVAPGAEAGDEQVQRQRGRLHHLGRDREQRHRRDVGRRAAVPDARIKRRAEREQQAQRDDGRGVHDASWLFRDREGRLRPALRSCASVSTSLG